MLNVPFSSICGATGVVYFMLRDGWQLHVGYVVMTTITYTVWESQGRIHINTASTEI